MTMRAMLVGVMLLAGVVGVVEAQAPPPELLNLWKQNKYDDVLPRLLDYRKQHRTWQIDYMIGTSQCHGSHRPGTGLWYLQTVLSYKQVPDSARQAVAQESRYCQSGGEAKADEPSFVLVPVTGQMTSAAIVSGKGGYTTIPTKAELTTTKAKITPVPVADLEKRVFARGQEEQALTAATARLGPKARGVAANGFVVVCAGCEVLDQVPRCLQKYVPPLRSEFDMFLPESLVTVYIPAQDIHEIVRYAKTLHGVELPLGTFAYSVLEDLSIVGIYGEGCGTLAHELVHLAIRTNFGDSPAWLEEGLASEIAVSGPGPTAFRFGKSWRDNTLRNRWTARPTVEQLLAATWAEFAATDAAALNRVAALHAMAAVFVRYLDAKQKLTPVYFAIRDGRVPSNSEEPRTDAAILTEQFGMNLNQIDADFVKWFGAQK